MIKKVSFTLSCILASPAVLANDNIQSVIDAFTNCDSSFFYQLKANAKEFDDIAELVIKDDIAYIPVEDVTIEAKNSYHFKQAIEYRGLTISGYQNIYIETPFLGQYYYWGFIIDGSVEAVKQSLKQLPWQQYNANSYVANAKRYDRQEKNAYWQNYPYTIDGVIPRAFTIEKSLYLEPINDNQVHLVCSIQGDMNKELLYTIHPDMQYVDPELDAKREAQIQALQQEKQLILEAAESNNDQSEGEL